MTDAVGAYAIMMQAGAQEPAKTISSGHASAETGPKMAAQPVTEIRPVFGSAKAVLLMLPRTHIVSAVLGGNACAPTARARLTEEQATARTAAYNEKAGMAAQDASLPPDETMTSKPALTVDERYDAAVGTPDELPTDPGSCPLTMYGSRMPPKQASCEELLTAQIDEPPQATTANIDELSAFTALMATREDGAPQQKSDEARSMMQACALATLSDTASRE